mmetsp:Transcript_15362/g.51726  ORF Transcript_15362/g.51726 Transcript_15362/m.51726 type:complete len:241 (-) Transcript_15362:340-1062(-)
MRPQSAPRRRQARTAGPVVRRLCDARLPLALRRPCRPLPLHLRPRAHDRRRGRRLPRDGAAHGHPHAALLPEVPRRRRKRAPRRAIPFHRAAAAALGRHAHAAALPDARPHARLRLGHGEPPLAPRDGMGGAAGRRLAQRAIRRVPARRGRAAGGVRDEPSLLVDARVHLRRRRGHVDEVGRAAGHRDELGRAARPCRRRALLARIAARGRLAARAVYGRVRLLLDGRRLCRAGPARGPR